MFPWLEALIAGATAACLFYLLPRIAPKSSGLVSKQTLDWTENIQRKYHIQGISIGIVALPRQDGGSWRKETHGFGTMDEKGRPIDGQVSKLHAHRLVVGAD